MPACPAGIARRASCVLLPVLLAGSAAAQDCFDYGQPGPDGSIEYVSLLLGPQDFQVSDLDTHGDLLGVRYFDMFGTIRGVAYYRLDQAGELSFLFHDGGGSAEVSVDYTLGRGDGNLVTYRRRVVGFDTSIQENHVVDVATAGFPGGLLPVYGSTWIRQGRAYVESGGELRVYGLEDPGNPADLGAVPEPSGAAALFDVDGRLAVITDDARLEIWDVAVPGAFTRLAALPLGFDPGDVAAGDGFLLATSSSDIFRIDLGDPAAPVVPAVGQDLGLGPLTGVAVGGSYGYVIWPGGLRALDLGDEQAVLLPARVTTDGGRFRLGRNRIFVLMTGTLYAAPVHCDGLVPATDTSLGGLKAWYR